MNCIVALLVLAALGVFCDAAALQNGRHRLSGAKKVVAQRRSSSEAAGTLIGMFIWY